MVASFGTRGRCRCILGVAGADGMPVGPDGPAEEGLAMADEGDVAMTEGCVVMTEDRGVAIAEGGSLRPRGGDGSAPSISDPTSNGGMDEAMLRVSFLLLIYCCR